MNNAFTLALYTGSEWLHHFTVYTNGWIGFGTSTPLWPFHVVSGAALFGVEPTTGLRIGFYPAGDYSFINSGDATKPVRIEASQLWTICPIITNYNYGVVRTSVPDQKQYKIVVTNLNVNVSFDSSNNYTVTIPITWSESFSGQPIAAYVSQVTNGGGFAQVIKTITGMHSGGATLWVNSRNSGSVNFDVQIVAIGPE